MTERNIIATKKHDGALDNAYQNEEFFHKKYKLFWRLIFPMCAFVILTGGLGWTNFEAHNVKSVVSSVGVLLSFFALKLVGLFSCVGVYLVGNRKKVNGVPCITLMNCTGAIIDLKISFDAYLQEEGALTLLAQKNVNVPHLAKPEKKTKYRTIVIPIPAEMQEWGVLDKHFIDITCVFVHELTNHRASTATLRLDKAYFEADMISSTAIDSSLAGVEQVGST